MANTDNAAQLESLRAMLQQSQRAYFRLAVQVSVATAILTVFTVEQLASTRHEGLVFFVLLISGHLMHLFSPPRSIKMISALVTAGAGVGAFALDPSGVSTVGLVGGLMSGGLHFVSAGVDAQAAALSAIDRVLSLRTIYNINCFLELLDWKRRHVPEASIGGTVNKLEQWQRATYSKGSLFKKRTVRLDWSHGLQDTKVKFKPRDTLNFIERAETIAISDFIDYQGKLYRYLVNLSQRAVIPLELADVIARQVPSLLDKYRHPEKYLESSSPEEDIVERVFGWVGELEERPLPRGEILQKALLAYCEVVRETDSLLEEQRVSGDRWKCFVKGLEVIRSTRVPSDYQETVSKIIEELEKQLKQRGLVVV